jgi:hypothetical protein
MYKLEVFSTVCLQYASCAGCPGWHGIRLLPSLWHLLELCRSNNRGCAAGGDTQETWQPFLLEP